MSRTRVPPQLRRQVQDRAGDRCEYCLAPGVLSFAVHQVDHVIAEKHGGPTIDANLALSCVACNQFKGTDLSSVDLLSQQTVPLYHPRKHRWSDHFRLDGVRIQPLTAIGRVTVRLLHFNGPERLTEREFFIAAGHLTAPQNQPGAD